MFMDKNDWSDDDLGDDVGDTLVVPMPTPQVLSGGGHSQYVPSLACLSDAPQEAPGRRPAPAASRGYIGRAMQLVVTLSVPLRRSPVPHSALPIMCVFSPLPHMFRSPALCLQGCARGQ